eukprot:377411_1
MSDSSDYVDASTSCSSLSESLKHHDAYWCVEYDANDWAQLWYALFLVYYIYMGHMLVSFALYRANMMSVAGIRLPNESTRWCEIILRNGTKPNQIVYIALNIIIHILYFIIKTLLVTSDHLSTSYEQYENMHFQEFVNIHTILLVTFFTFNPGLFWIVYFSFNGLSGFLNSQCGIGMAVLIAFGCFFLLGDILFSLVVLCIYYPLFIAALYFIAVELLSLLLVLFALFCLSMWCCTCCMHCVDSHCVEIRLTNGEVHFNYETLCQKNSTIVLMSLLLLFITLCITLLEFWGIFAFVGGPTPFVLYLEFDDNVDFAILCVLLIIMVLGTISVLVSAINIWCPCACCDVIESSEDVEDYENESQDSDRQVLL